MKKLKAGDSDYTCVKEVLMCTINTEAGTLALLERKIQELTQLLTILVT